MKDTGILTHAETIHNKMQVPVQDLYSESLDLIALRKKM